MSIGTGWLLSTEEELSIIAAASTSYRDNPYLLREDAIQDAALHICGAKYSSRRYDQRKSTSTDMEHEIAKQRHRVYLHARRFLSQSVSRNKKFYLMHGGTTHEQD